MAFRLLLCLMSALGGVALAQPPEPALTAREVPRVTLAHHPGLAAARQERGIARAGVVLAKVYPYNPLLTFLPQIAYGGPPDAVTKPFTSGGSTLTLEIEMPGQRRHRVRAAQDALSRAEWEVAAKELDQVGKAVRAFNQVIYRQEKLKFLEANADLARKAVGEIQEARGKKKEALPPGERILLEFEVQEAKAQVVAGRVPLTAARQELAQALGLDRPPAVRGDLRITNRTFAVADLQGRARELRPDVHARRAAVAEAEARWRLERAGRFGNPVVGPAYTTNEVGIQYLGATITVPVPVLNRKQGEILQRQAEIDRAAAELRQAEVQADQDVASALARLAEIQDLIRLYEKDYLPSLARRSGELERLYVAEDPGVDVQQVLELRRRLLKVRESYLDALFEHGQIEVDLAVAIGDLELAFDPD